MIDFTVDDAHISFRYAENLAAGHGLRWNVDEAPVEGFTNLLWVLIGAAGVVLGVAPETVAHLFSVVAVLAVVTLIVSAADIIPDRGTRAALACGYAASPSVWVHSASGLETLSFAALTTYIVIATLGDRRSVPLYLALLFLPLLGGYWYLRTLYFGHLFPLPFYVKVGHPGAGLRWLLRTIGLTIVPLALCLGAVIRSRQIRPMVLKLLTFLLPFACLYGLSSLHMDYAHRFLHHIWPILLLLAGVSLSAVVTELGGRDSARSAGTLIALIALGTFAPLLWRSGLGWAPRYGRHQRAAPDALGHALRTSKVPPEFRSLFVGEAGSIPRFSGWRSIDYIGLNTPDIARRAREPLTILRNQRPTLLILYSKDHRTPRRGQVGFSHDDLHDALSDLGYVYIGGLEGYPANHFVLYVNEAVPQKVRQALLIAIEPLERWRLDSPGAVRL